MLHNDEATRKKADPVAGIKDRLRQWKLSPMDLEFLRPCYEFSGARDRMLKASDSKHAPWYVIRSDDKWKARLNHCISHFLSLIRYKKTPRSKVKLPERSNKRSYDDQVTPKGRHFVPERY